MSVTQAYKTVTFDRLEMRALVETLNLRIDMLRRLVGIAKDRGDSSVFWDEKLTVNEAALRVLTK